MECVKQEGAQFQRSVNNPGEDWGPVGHTDFQACRQILEPFWSSVSASVDPRLPHRSLVQVGSQRAGVCGGN